MSQAVLILGATSGMGRELARILASQGRPLFLASSDQAECEYLAQDLRIRFKAHAETGCFDATRPETHGPLLQTILERLGGLGTVVSMVGTMGEDPATLDPVEAARIISTNFTGVVSMLSLCASYLVTAGRGTILGVTSVAGDRGRASNFAYGAAKAGLGIWLQGLRNCLHPKGIRVVTFKPGFVDTAMTWGRPGLFLVASPSSAAKAMARALDRGPEVVYFPRFWGYLMFTIGLIPEFIFKRMRL